MPPQLTFPQKIASTLDFSDRGRVSKSKHGVSSIIHTCHLLGVPFVRISKRISSMIRRKPILIQNTHVDPRAWDIVSSCQPWAYSRTRRCGDIHHPARSYSTRVSSNRFIISSRSALQNGLTILRQGIKLNWCIIERCSPGLFDSNTKISWPIWILIALTD